MNNTVDIAAKLQELMPVMKSKFHVSRIGYFGSYATGQNSSASDLDLLVEFSRPIGWEFFTLEKFLEQHVGLNIDLVTKGALKERIKQSILNQVKYI